MTTIEKTCLNCDGEGELECEHCHHSHECPDCDGEGSISCEVSDLTIPERHPKKAELLALQADALKCQADHEKLCALNPRAKESYDAQLAKALAAINEQVEALLK